MKGMHLVDTKELKHIQNEILDVFAEFCVQNDLHYWIDCGTLLGAVRHKGYIPWDDDIDVGMLRKDYEKLIALFNNSRKGRYLFKSIETDKDYPFAFGKILDTSTVMYEPDKKGIRHSINIDVFPYDDAPDDKRRLKRMYLRRDVYKSLRLMQLGILKPNGSILKQMSIKIISNVLKIFPQNFFTKKILNNAKRYDGKNNYVGDFTSTGYIYCDKAIFSSFVQLEFEGRWYSAPVGYDKWLKSMYGDYMRLPPEEERVSNHFFIAYAKDKKNQR